MKSGGKGDLEDGKEDLEDGKGDLEDGKEDLEDGRVMLGRIFLKTKRRDENS